MSFWSGETLATRLPALVTPYDPARIDCASYTLTLGAEAFITTDQRLDDSADRGLKLSLQPGDQCRIPPGQFAFLLTEEEVQVPTSALAFISMRARWKFRGLVNVSGFHVDPGWSGKLVFSVYNAGPSPIVLSRGAEVFLIWYADLDQNSGMVKTGSGSMPSIPDQLVEGMTGQVFSPIALNKDVSELKERAIELREEISSRHLTVSVDLTELKTDFKFYKSLVWTILVVVMGFLAKEILPGAVGLIRDTYHEARRLPIDSRPVAPTSPMTMQPPSSPIETTVSKQGVESKGVKGPVAPPGNASLPSNDKR